MEGTVEFGALVFSITLVEIFTGVKLIWEHNTSCTEKDYVEATKSVQSHKQCGHI